LPATHSEAILPLKVGDRVTGVLDIHSEAPDAFTSEDIEILNILADQAAIIIEDARLFSETAQALPNPAQPMVSTCARPGKNCHRKSI